MKIYGSESEYIVVDWEHDLTPEEIVEESSDDEKDKLINLLTENQVLTLFDKEKIDFLKENLNRISLEDLESICK